MARVRTDNVFGTLTDNPLTNVATTMNSAGLANLAAVSSKEAIIILDPNRVAGAPEIVVVTAHTGAATSATIQRGQFGTAARQHAAGTEWVHGPIAGNATTYATAADDQGDFVPVDGWETWTPTLTNITTGNGTVTAHFARIGRFIAVHFKFVMGTTSAMGTGPQFTLPVAPRSTWGFIGYCTMTNVSSVIHAGYVQLASGSTCNLRVMTADTTYVGFATISATVPFTWDGTDGDNIEANFFYEAAS